MIKIYIASISIAVDPKTGEDILYGIDLSGIVYWYRQADWLDSDTKKVIKTRGWVSLEMVISQEILPDEKPESQT